MKCSKTNLLILLVAFFNIISFPQLKKIYIANDDHTDYLWNFGERTYNNAFLNMLDYYLDLADATANEPPEYQSKFNCDGTYWLWIYQQSKTSDQFDRLISRIKSGHISVPMNPLSLCLGGAPTEAVIRCMYYAGELERKYNMRFKLAVAMENQTLPYGLISLWAGSGAKYAWKGVCNCNTTVTNLFNRDREIYWSTGPDGSQVLMKWHSLYTNNMNYGGYAEAWDPAFAVDFADTSSAFKSRYKFNIIGAFGQGWDGLQNLTDEFIQTAKEKTNLYRKVIVSNIEDFFIDFENTYGSSIPSYGASFGNEWDVYCASIAEVTANIKRAVEKLRSAEALAALVSLQNSSFIKQFENTSRDVWMKLGLYWEHNWSVEGEVTIAEKISWLRNLESAITNYVNSLYSSAASELGKMIIKSGSDKRFFVFNQLNWSRTDIADIPYNDNPDIHVINLATGNETPFQLIKINSQQYLRVLAQNIPPVGYNVFEIKNGKGKDFGKAVEISDDRMENEFYKLKFSEWGALTSLIHKADNKEYADNSNGYYINDLGKASGKVKLDNSGPVSATLVAESSYPLNHKTKLTLFRDIPRIEISNEILQNFSNTYTWTFNFNINSPSVWHEELGAVIKASLESNGGNYSARNSRFDWLTLNHFFDMSDFSGSGITLSNSDCSFMKLGDSKDSYLDVYEPRISVLTGGQVDGSFYGIPNQGGDTYFLQRFALQPHKMFDPAASMRFSLEHQNPFAAAYIEGGESFPEKYFSLISIDDPDVMLWSLKPAEEGVSNGLICRLWNVNSSGKNFNLSIKSGNIHSAYKTTHLETVLSSASHSGNTLSEYIGGNQIQTYQIGFTIDILPVELTAFSAAANENIVELKWETATEIDNHGFELERSPSGENRQWKSIAFIQGAGNSSSPNKYVYSDNVSGQGTSFIYRLKQIDNDGSFKYLREIEISLAAVEFKLFQNFPNPFNSATAFKFSLNSESHVKLTIFNVLGQELEKIFEGRLFAGYHEINYDAAALPSGVYIYKLEAAGYNAINKLVILK